MTKSQHPENIITNNNQSLKSILRVIQFSQGQFRLILVRCNYRELRDRIIPKLQESSPIPIHQFSLPESAKSLYMAIRAEVENHLPQALLVLGLESVRNMRTLLTSSHYIREEFPRNFPFPLFLWVNDEVLGKFRRLVPDFASWATTIEFELSTDELRDLLRQKIQDIFDKEETINLQDCWEFNAACLDWQQRGETLEDDLDASLEFVRGKEAFSEDNIDDALIHYRHSHKFWEKVENLERQGILLVNIARCYDRKAEQNRRKCRDYWHDSRDHLQYAIELFDSGQRLDLVARYINQLCTVLRRLEDWKELEIWAQKALYFFQNPKPLWAKDSTAKYYGFLAGVGIGRLDYTEAKRLARKTLEILEAIPNCQPYEKCLSRFILAQAEWHFGQKSQAIGRLKQVKEECQPQDDPELYINSLEELRSIYLEEGEYKEAFDIKQEIRAIEYQYGFKSFVGAGLLPPQPRSQEGIVPNPQQVNREIAASGREGDVKKLLERISSIDKKLIVIHGYSGVGKSSILTAGLIPALRRNPIEARDVLPVLVRFYSNWVGELGNVLAKALQETARILDPPQPCLLRGEQDLLQDSLKGILAQLRTNSNENSNLFTVLIFDQFEEFFFVCTDKRERRIFFEFFRNCLDIPYVKVIFSLREDYVHYLFEGEQFNLDAIDNNILDKDFRYPLRNFYPNEAKTVIKNLTERSHFDLDLELLNELVQDLAGDLGEIRPIELQIVGAQLEADKITTLAKYRQYGSKAKEKLVEKWLDVVIKDCGDKNQQAVQLVLYFLTNDKDTRPMKTQAELASNFQMEDFESEVERLEFVLLALVGSGLVLKIPDTPMPRYQLVHDYLVSFIRQLQQALGVEARKQEKLKLLEMRSQNDYLENQLSEMRSQNDYLENQLSEMRSQNDYLENQLSEMRSQNDYLKDQLSKIESSLAYIIQEFKLEKKTLLDSISQKKNELSEKQKELSKKINELLLLESQNNYLQGQLSSLKKQPPIEKIIESLKKAHQAKEKMGILSKLKNKFQTPNTNLEISAESWNKLCRNGSIYGYGADVMFACEKAVTLDPQNGNFRDSRGLARALTKDRYGAIEDFEYSITVSHISSLEARNQRRRWINELRKGNNPFTQDELNKLLIE